jgi:serine/threonine-protein kinase
MTVLGYGAKSTIYAVQDKENHVFALKRVVRERADDKKFIRQAINEFHIAGQVDHPNVRRCFAIKRLRKFLTVGEVLLIMELVDGQNLVQHRPTRLVDLVKAFISATDGLGAVHKAGFVHADMKPNNILITDSGVIKIIDFGQSCPIGTIKDRIQGTPDYIAPEQVKRRALTVRTDIFNLGAAMYWCLTDSHIPTLIPRTPNEIGLKTEMELRPLTDFNPDLPAGLSNLVVNCLAYRPEDRPESMSELRVRLELLSSKLDPAQPTRPGW